MSVTSSQLTQTKVEPLLSEVQIIDEKSESTSRPVRLLANPFTGPWAQKWYTPLIRSHLYLILARGLLLILPLLVFLVVVLLVLFLVIVPIVVRDMVDHISITAEALQISLPTDTGFQVSGRQYTSSVPLNPAVDGFTARISDIDNNGLFDVLVAPFTGTNITIVSQNVTILDQSAFLGFSRSIVEKASMDLRLSGNTNVHVRVAHSYKIRSLLIHLQVLSRNVPVTINTTLSIGGLETLTLNLTSVTTSNTTFYAATTAYYSGSVISLNLGLSNFQVEYNDTVIGIVRNLVNLAPGASTFDSTGTASITGLASQPASLSSLLALAKAGSEILVTIQGLNNTLSTWANASIGAFRHDATLTADQVKEVIGTLGSGTLAALGL